MQKTSKTKLTPEIITLHRYFIWADRMKVHFDEVLTQARKTNIDNDFIKKKEGIDTFLYMSLWYATFYVLIEGWQELKLKDAKIDSLLQSKNVGLLKRYRNGVFHYQKKYMDDRFTQLITEGINIAFWIRELREEFSRWFLVVHKEK